jgi:hypothetical protein
MVEAGWDCQLPTSVQSAAGLKSWIAAAEDDDNVEGWKDAQLA